MGTEKWNRSFGPSCWEAGLVALSGVSQGKQPEPEGGWGVAHPQVLLTLPLTCRAKPEEAVERHSPGVWWERGSHKGQSLAVWRWPGEECKSHFYLAEGD